MRRNLSRSEFYAEVRRVLRNLPTEFQGALNNVVVDVLDQPSDDDWDHASDSGRDPDELLLGLFVGVPLTEQSAGESTPCQVKLFRLPIEEISRSRSEVRTQIRNTLLHELAHFFGYSEEEIEKYEQKWEEG